MSPLSLLIDDAEPLRLGVLSGRGLEKDSCLLVDQVRAIDNKRLISGPLQQLDQQFRGRIYQAVAEVLGM